MDINLNKEKWLTRGISKVDNINDNLTISFKSDEKHKFEYVYYNAITGFSKYNDLDIKYILKNRVYKISFNGNIEGNMDVRLFINTYSYEDKLSNNSIPLNDEEVICTKEDVKSAKIAIRISGQGRACINNISIKHDDKENYLEKILNQSRKTDLEYEKYLVLTNIYPSENDLYRNAFVHRRVKLYKEYGLNVDVYAMKPKGAFLSKYEFDGVNIYKGDYESLEILFKNNKYKKILIHFVNKDMIRVINKYCENTPVIVWLHGYEASKWRHRIFNYTEEEIKKYGEMWDKNDEKKMEFLRSIYTNKKYHFIIVSKWFKGICEKDSQCKILNYSIIPNVVDENIFKYTPKTEDYRRKILSIRSYASNNYANDLTIKAILELSKRDIFNKLEFNIYGSGILFEDLTSKVRKFENVKIYNKFITQYEIAKLHKENGIFLSPTRLDTHGVSMCEAMSSGLVCISNDVSAISEYLNENCGILARSESYIDIANAIEYLYNNPSIYLKMSENASHYIQDRCGIKNTIKREIEVIES